MKLFSRKRKNSESIFKKYNQYLHFETFDINNIEEVVDNPKLLAAFNLKFIRLKTHRSYLLFDVSTNMVLCSSYGYGFRYFYKLEDDVYYSSDLEAVIRFNYIEKEIVFDKDYKKNNDIVIWNNKIYKDKIVYEKYNFYKSYLDYLCIVYDDKVICYYQYDNLYEIDLKVVINDITFVKQEYGMILIECKIDSNVKYLLYNKNTKSLNIISNYRCIIWFLNRFIKFGNIVYDTVLDKLIEFNDGFHTAIAFYKNIISYKKTLSSEYFLYDLEKEKQINSPNELFEFDSNDSCEFETSIFLSSDELKHVNKLKSNAEIMVYLFKDNYNIPLLTESSSYSTEFKLHVKLFKDKFYIPFGLDYIKIDDSIEFESNVKIYNLNK